MEYIKHKGRLVLPVFYQVEPSDVRHQRGSYAEAYKSNINDEKTVKEWRFALKKVADLSGWHFQQGRREFDFKEDSVKWISCGRGSEEAGPNG
ncbi:hypothetical protein RJT34_16762 [Clitoria ternatea]|uniref:TIR domain-containing protein n=1 Tax=Clitoria ternatea TaxID=43366 RepID=A0AAN9PCI7_CLITE